MSTKISWDVLGVVQQVYNGVCLYYAIGMWKESKLEILVNLRCHLLGVMGMQCREIVLRRLIVDITMHIFICRCRHIYNWNVKRQLSPVCFEENGGWWRRQGGKKMESWGDILRRSTGEVAFWESSGMGLDGMGGILRRIRITIVRIVIISIKWTPVNQVGKRRRTVAISGTRLSSCHGWLSELIIRQSV